MLPYLDTVQNANELDETVSSWVEEQFSEGAPLYRISDALSGLHYYQPWTKGLLTRSWKLFSIWRRHEVPLRAPPMTEDVMVAFSGKAYLDGNFTFATLLMLGFHTCMRTHEMLIVSPADFVLGSDSGIVTIAASKSGVRHNVKESVAITDRYVLELCRQMVDLKKSQGMYNVPCWELSGTKFRETLYSLSAFFKIEHLGLKGYSIRRGGATFEFRLHGLMEKTLIRGRWASTAVARLYITDSVAQLSQLKITTESRRLLEKFSTVFTVEYDSLGKRGKKARRAWIHDHFLKFWWNLAISFWWFSKENGELWWKTLP